MDHGRFHVAVAQKFLVSGQCGWPIRHNASDRRLAMMGKAACTESLPCFVNFTAVLDVVNDNNRL